MMLILDPRTEQKSTGASHRPLSGAKIRASIAVQHVKGLILTFFGLPSQYSRNLYLVGL